MVSPQTNSKRLLIFGVTTATLALVAISPLVALAVFLCLFGLGVTLFYLNEANYKMIFFLFVVSVIQNAVVILIMGMAGVPQAFELQYYKEIFLIAILLYFLVFKNRLFNNITPTDLVALLFVIYIFSGPLWLGESTTFGIIASLRQLLVPFMFYFLGKHIELSRENLIKLLNRFAVFGVVIVAFGLIESYVWPTFWADVNIRAFFEERRGEHLRIHQGMPTNFFTSDFVAIVGEPLRRMASFVANPPVLAHILAFLAIFVLFTGKYTGKKTWFYFLFICLGIATTIGKGGIITVAIGGMFYVLFIWKKPLLTYLLSGVGAVAAFLYIQNVINQGLSAVDHIFGFTNSLEYGLTHPLGAGVGMVGNLAEVHNDAAVTVSEGGGAESFLGLVAGQLGLIGLILYTLFFILICYQMLKLMYVYRQDKFFYSLNAALVSLMVSIFVTGVLTESAVSFTSAGMPILLASIVVNHYRKIVSVEANEVRKVKRRKRYKIVWS